MWLPLLPRGDGTGYELPYYDAWRPVDFRKAARVPVSANASIASLGSTITPEAFQPAVGGGIGAQASRMQPVGAAAKVTPVDPPAGSKTHLSSLQAFGPLDVFVRISTLANQGVLPLAVE